MSEATLTHRDIYLRTEAEQIVFGNAETELRFSMRSGAWLALLDRKTGQKLVGWGAETPAAAITVGGRTTNFRGRNHLWSLRDTETIGAHARYQAHEGRLRDDGVELRVTLREGPWTLTAIYFLAWAAPAIERRLAIAYDGDEESLLRYAQLYVPGIRVGNPADCLIEAPGYGTPPHQPLVQLPQGRWEAIPDNTGGEAPGWATGLIIIHDAKQHHCLMTWSYSEVEPALAHLERNGDELMATHQMLVADRFLPGHSIECGTQFLSLVRGDSDEALRRFQAWYDEMGITAPADISDSARDAVLYEVHIGEFKFGSGTTHAPLPDCRALIERLPAIKELGFNTIQLMPRFPYPDYAVHDYFDIATHYGPVAEVKELVSRSHNLGMRVILDVVLHGCVDKSVWNRPEALERSPYLDHPDWFLRDERGNIAMTYTYAFDHANEEWRRHVIDAMKMYVAELDVDGFRVDAVTWNFFPNWRKGLPYRASASMQGSWELMNRARRELKALKPDIFLYTESSGALFHTCFDLAYNYDEQWMCSALLDVISPRGFARRWRGRRITAREAREWLQARAASLPRGALKVWHLDSHDSYMWEGLAQFRKEAFGIPAARALFAFCAFREGGLMSYIGAEEGSEAFYQRVIQVREGFHRWRFSYAGVDSSDDMVFPMLWECDGRYALPLINFRPQKTTTRLCLSDAGVKEDGLYALRELMSDCALGTLSGRELRDREIELEAHEVKVLAVAPAPSGQP